MKLLYLTHEDINRTAVAKAMMYDIAMILSEKYEVSVISATDKKNKNERFYTDGNVNNIKFCRSVYGGVDIIDVFKLFLFSFSILFNIVRNDVVFVRSYPMMIFGLMGKLVRKKVIFDPRGLGFLEMVDSGKVKKYLSVSTLQKIERLFIKYSDVVICVSEAHKDYYINEYQMNEKYKVIYNGTENEFNNPILDITSNEVFKIVYLGSLIKWHCPERVNALLENIHNKGVLFEFHCITKDIKKAEDIFKGDYKKIIYSHQYRSNPIKFNLGVCLIADTLSKSACFPVKFSEYLSSGTPVVFSNNVDVCKKVSEKQHVGLGINLSENDDYIAERIISYLNNNNNNEVNLPQDLTKKVMIDKVDAILSEFNL
ncbi:glycosyltransferase [Mesoflavibacter zeaxanthinifaciens]|uniref:glycosyltransferase n=1 Tax=Mesoflavibacter zeaxanthinifaciens TaxID=393060 RepID=UPI003A90B661